VVVHSQVRGSYPQQLGGDRWHPCHPRYTGSESAPYPRPLRGAALQDDRALQPYLAQALSGVGKEIIITREGQQVLEFVTSINGQRVLVRFVQLAEDVWQISDAWVITR